MKFRCAIGFHKNKDVKRQIIKGMLFRDLPALRVVKKCELCDTVSYQSLNLAVPYKDLINDKLWS